MGAYTAPMHAIWIQIISYGKLEFPTVRVYKNPNIVGFIKIQYANQSSFGTLIMRGHASTFHGFMVTLILYSLGATSLTVRALSLLGYW